MPHISFDREMFEKINLVRVISDMRRSIGKLIKKKLMFSTMTYTVQLHNFEKINKQGKPMTHDHCQVGKKLKK